MIQLISMEQAIQKKIAINKDFNQDLDSKKQAIVFGISKNDFPN